MTSKQYLLVILLLSFRKVATTVTCPSYYAADNSSLPICYRDYGITVTFNTASSTCNTYKPNSTVPMFRNEMEWTNLYKLLAGVTNSLTKNFWIGLTAQTSMTSSSTISTSSYTWLNGTAKTFDYWNTIPTDVNHRCVIASDNTHNLSWVPTDCSQYRLLVCQFRPDPICAPGFVEDASNSICYLFDDNNVTAQQAQDFCHSRTRPSNLPIFHSNTEYYNFKTLATSLNKYGMSWLGASRPCNKTNSGSSFIWMDNTNFGTGTSYYWNVGNPNNIDPDNTNIQQNCLIMDGKNSFKWDDQQCNRLSTTVCQYRVTAGATNYKFSAPLCLLNTSAICAPGYAVDASNSTCYLFDDNSVTAQHAQDFCQSRTRPSNLPVFHSSIEFNNFVALAISLNKTGRRWLGASRPCNLTNNVSSFSWLDNSNLGTWASFGPGNPDNAAGSTNIQQNCVVYMDNANYNWNDKQCNNLQYTVCQYRVTDGLTNYQFSAPLCVYNTSVSCTPLINPSNGHVIISNPSYAQGTVANFTCDSDYTLVGPSTVVCQSDLNWTNTSATTCQLNQCSSQPCQNYGTCLTQSDGSYVCNCGTGYRGTNCENINSCVTGSFSQSGTDSCAPNGMCISSVGEVQCLCNDNFFGNRCQYRNCSAIAWSEWSNCAVKKCDVGTGVRNRTHTGFADCNPQYDFQQCTGGCEDQMLDQDYVPPLEDPMSHPARIVSTISQSIGCTVLVICVSVTFGLFACFKIMFLERMLHMFQEISLFVGHVTLIIVMKLRLTKSSCSIVGIFLQFSFLTNFTFLCLEALQTFCVLQNVISTGGFFSVKINLAIGLCAPFAVTLLAAMTMFKFYPSKYSCWVNLGSKTASATYIPVVALTVVSVILTEAAAMGDFSRLPLTPVNKYVAAEVSQKMAVLKILFNVLTFTAGQIALYYQRVEWYGSLLLINSMFGGIIFVAHTSGNERVIQYLKSVYHRLKRRTQ